MLADFFLLSLFLKEPFWQLSDAALAVSGGVDSMALVVLCKRLNKDFPNSAVKPRAFVVDHAARSGSDIEASQVAKAIREMGDDPLLS